MRADDVKSENRAEPHFLSWLFTNRVTLGLAAIVSLITAFYIEEDLRGKWAWQRCRRQLQADGAVLDWNAFIPARVPEAENVFGAPRMKDWFVFGGLNDMSLRTNKVPLVKYLNERELGKVAEISLVPIRTNSIGAEGEIVLRYDSSVVTLLRQNGIESHRTGPEPEIIPLIVLDEVPLADAIRNLANQAAIKYAFTPEVANGFVPAGKPQPSVTIRWENITARHALTSLLANYGLILVENPKTQIALIRADDGSQPKVYVEADASEELTRHLRQAITTNAAPYANGSQGLKLVAKATATKPFHIQLQVSQPPSPTEMKQMIPVDVLRGLPGAGNQFSIERSETNTFIVSLAPQVTPAADYLAWNDRFLSDFDHIREALKRPVVRIDGNYSQPFSQPRLDYVTIRIMAQTLGQRAQCYLLLGQPEKALHELMLLHDMNRLMEGKPVTLVAAMIEVAITGVYINVIEDGFRLDAWREPQFITLEQQLEDTNLLTPLRDAFLSERAGVCQLFETQSAAKIQQSVAFPPTTQTFWQRLQNPRELLFSLAPRGWNQQNMVVFARLAGKYVEGFDSERQIFLPGKLEASANEVQSSLGHLNPQNFLAAMCLPNFRKGCQTAAHTQALVKEAEVACALERYRISHGEFPENLDQLVPQLMQKASSDVIGGRPLRYRRTSNDRYVLYSVGWNERDDGGDAVRKENGYLVIEEGDWPWEPRDSER